MLWGENVWQLCISGEVWHQTLWCWHQFVLPPKYQQYYHRFLECLKIPCDAQVLQRSISISQSMQITHFCMSTNAKVPQ